MVATAGALPPAAVASYVSSHGPDVDVVVMTAIEVPRTFLQELEAEGWDPLEDERTAETERAVAGYVEERGLRLVQPIVGALDAIGVTAQALLVEHSEPATAILEAAAELGTDLIVVGATKPLFAESAWQSVAQQLMVSSPVPLLMVPGVRRAEDDDEDEAGS